MVRHMHTLPLTHYLLLFPVVYANAGGEVLKRDATNAFTKLID